MLCDFEFEEKDEARTIMIQIGNLFRDWNYAPWDPSVLDAGEAKRSSVDGKDKDKDED